MTTSPFAAPAPATSFDMAAHLGRLLVIEPVSVETGMHTNYGEKDAIRATIHVIDTQPATTHEDVLVFPMVLQGQLRPRIGQMVLGRLEQGAAKPGQNPPWRITEATPADQQTAAAWLAQRQPTFAQPAPAQPQYAPQPAPAQQPQYQQPALPTAPAFAATPPF